MFHDFGNETKTSHTIIEHAKFAIVDAHIHLGGRYRFEQYWKKYDLADVISGLRNLGVCHVVNLELFTKKHWDFAWNRTAPYREFVSMCAPINFERINDDDFESITLDEMNYYSNKGACGFKVWKSLGLYIRKSNGELYSPNDPRLSFIWKEAAHLGLPIVIHIGDPPSFWEPVDACNERYVELAANPKWSYCGLEIKYVELLQEMEMLLRNNPQTIFVAAHLCSAAHDLDYVSKLLDAYENLYVDVAAVLSEIGRRPARFKIFASEYCDRILFGTDYFAGDILPHIPFFRFLETAEEDFPYMTDGSYSQGLWNISGCKLPENVLEKIYSENARRVFGILGVE